MQNINFNSKLKKGDEVIVTSGKNKGSSGKIKQVFTTTSRVLVEGVNMIKKHISAKQAIRLQREPGVITKEASIAISNIALKDPKTGKPTKVGYKTEADGSKVRIAKASGTVIDTIKKAKTAGSTKAAKPAKAAAKPAAKAKPATTAKSK
jgi:large subunit ribosomal protein L24